MASIGARSQRGSARKVQRYIPNFGDGVLSWVFRKSQLVVSITVSFALPSSHARLSTKLFRRLASRNLIKDFF